MEHFGNYEDLWKNVSSTNTTNPNFSTYQHINYNYKNVCQERKML